MRVALLFLGDRSTLPTCADLAAAQDVFLRYGLRRTNMEDVADAAGVSRPALYQYFRNKSDLWTSLVSELHETTLKAVAAELEQRGDLEPRLARAMIARDGRFKRLRATTIHAYEVFGVQSGETGAITLKANDLYETLIRDMLVSEGYDAFDARNAAEILVAAAAGLMERHDAPETYDRALKALVTYVVAGLDALS